MKTKIIKPLLVALTFIFASCTLNPDSSNISSLAESWVASSYESKDAALNMVKENMSDDGYNIGSRYIGFGFNFNSDAMETDGMVVTNVIDGGPASSVLKVGDKFISVNEVLVNQESIGDGSLSFRGTPGVPVSAIILRDGEEISITVERGIVEPTYSKAQIIQNISNADADNWGENSLGYEIREVVADAANGVVYVKTWDKFLDDVSGFEAEALTLTRFEFDQNGKVLNVGNMTESELVLRQTGWSITR
ncbi:MAG: hypothetical protein CMC38_00015 [Flavobacteriaceae bacterium]|nr:hypothetical protein [Flavobacteriaceae bacterium]|tara:strand:- start:2774 stop:3523 length:750 start_codon:yes stop_codon:yes gene_type:complete